MINNYKAILFDFDFTLGDSSSGICESINYALAGTKHDHATDESICKLIGLPLKLMFTGLTDSEDAAIYESFRNFFNERAEQVVTENTVLYSSVPELLSELRSSGKQLGIISTKVRERLEEILTKFQIEHHFDIVLGGNDVTNHKPDPEGLLLAIKQLSLESKDVLYVGDSIIDAETAQRAGVDFVATLTGTTSAVDFHPYRTMKAIPNLDHLI